MGPLNSWEAVAVGSAHAWGIAGGALYCFGDNGNGQLGDNSDKGHQVPVQVSGPVPFAL